jgi:hypothetical protein
MKGIRSWAAVLPSIIMSMKLAEPVVPFIWRKFQGTPFWVQGAPEAQIACKVLKVYFLP